MNDIEKRHVEWSLTINQLIWNLIKARFRFGNKKIVTTSYQRFESIGRVLLHDKGKDSCIYIEGS